MVLGLQEKHVDELKEQHGKCCDGSKKPGAWRTLSMGCRTQNDGVGEPPRDGSHGEGSILWQVILTHVQVWEVLFYSFKVHTVGTYSLPYTVLGLS